MILQLIRVRPSEYQARYSPLITLFLTVIFSPCQNASFVSNIQPLNSPFLIYWKEYFPFSSTSEKSRFSERIIKYSLSAFVFSIWMFFTDQPNSGETISQFLIVTLEHSLSALI